MKTIPSQPTDTPTAKPMLFLALELSKASWQLCFSDGKRIRRRRVLGGNLPAVLKEIQRCQDKFGLESCQVHSCYEAGRDGFWIHRALWQAGIQNRVFDSASIEVNRQRRHTKTDRVDAEKLVRLLIRIVLGGETKACAVVHVPTVEQEAQMRLGRERERLVKEQTAHRSRIRSLVQLFGLEIKGPVDQCPVRKLKDAQGEPLSESLVAELEREQHRLQVVMEQIASLEAEQKRQLKARQTQATAKGAKLMLLRGVGPQGAWMLPHEFFWRDFHNRKQVGACAGLTGCPYDSGSSQREQGITKAGSRRIRALSIELAWNWVRFQPSSQLTQWFVRRFGSGKRHRRVGIVALARKLLIALWKYLETDQWPEGAELKQR